jgi:predicted nucleic acid-binding protein
MAEQAARIIDGDQDLHITAGALAEVAYVLRSVYEVPREVIIDQLIELVERWNISTFGISKGLVLQALLMCRPSGRVSIADAMIWASARAAGNPVVYSFDQRFPSDGIQVLRDLL